MKMITRIWEWLTKSNRKTSSKGHPDLNPYDVAGLVKELKLREEARRLGVAGVPSPEATRLSGAEAEAVQRVDRVRQDYVDWAVTRVAILNEQLEKTDITQLVNRAKQTDAEFEREASSLMTDYESSLRPAGESVRQLSSELAAFKAEHKLTRSAAYPTKAGSYLRIAFLLFLIVIEGILNASFFAKGSDSGLLGGILYAMMFSAINVLIAYSLGRWPARYFYHHGKKKIIGLLGGLSALVLMIIIGLGVAHYRDALSIDMDSPELWVVQVLLSSPFAIKDLFSWLLFFISIIFAILAFFDGLKSDDKYPGYGSIARKVQQAIDEYEQELQDLRSELDALRSEKLEILDTAMKDAQTNVNNYARLIHDKKSAELRLTTALRDAANSLDAVLLIFRQENEVARNGLPRPVYFDQPTELMPITLPDFGTNDNESSLAQQRIICKTLTDELEEIRAKIQKAYNQKFDYFKPLQQHFDTER